MDHSSAQVRLDVHSFVQPASYSASCESFVYLADNLQQGHINQWLGHSLLTNQYLCVLFLQAKQINSSEVKVKELTEQNTKLQRSHHSVQVGCRKKVPCLLLTGTKPLGTSSTVHVFIIWTDDY